VYIVKQHCLFLIVDALIHYPPFSRSLFLIFIPLIFPFWQLHCCCCLSLKGKQISPLIRSPTQHPVLPALPAPQLHFKYCIVPKFGRAFKLQLEIRIPMPSRMPCLYSTQLSNLSLCKHDKDRNRNKRTNAFAFTPDYQLKALRDFCLSTSTSSDSVPECLN